MDMTWSLINVSKTVVESKSIFWKDVKVPDNIICVPTVGFKYNTADNRY